jgi:hypothetical protein
MTPAPFNAGGMFPSGRRAWLGGVAVACCVLTATEAFSQASGTQTSNRFVIVNNTGLPDDAVFLTFNSTVTGTGGGSTTLESSTAYSLEQLKGTVPGASGSGPVGTVPTFDLNTFSGRVYVALGNNTPMTAWPGPGGNTTVAGALELYVDPTNNNGHQNNGDISYVDYYSIPQNFKVKTLNGTAVPGIGQIVTTSGPIIGNLLTSSTAITPMSARYQANYSVLDTSGSSVGTMTGLAQVVSPQNNASYPGFGSFFAAMLSSSTSLTVASYQTPGGPATPPGNPKPGTLYGFGGVPLENQTSVNVFDPTGTPATGQPGSQPSWAGSRSEAWYTTQSYSLSAEYVSDLTAGLPTEAVTRLGTQGITGSTAGLRMFTSGYVSGTSNNATASSVGDYGIYITAAQLQNNASTYGANPQYVIDWGGAATTTTGSTGTDAQIVTTSDWNSLSDRVVGDFMAAMTFGWGLAGTATSGTTYTVAQHAVSTDTAAVLVNSIFDAQQNPTGPAAGPIGALSTGEYFYLIDLQTGTGKIGDWTGSGIQPTQPTWYDTYGTFQPETDAYAFPYGDRLQMNSPDIFWWPGGSETELGTFYMEWTLSPGSYVFAPVPEPSAIALVGISGAALGGLTWRRRRGPARQPAPE